MIVQVIGPNGAGKSTVVRRLLKADGEPLYGTHELILGYSVPRYQTGVVGRYTSPCGGCDTISSQDEVKARIKKFAKHYKHVVFEGVIVSTCFGSYLDFLTELGKPFTFAFLLPTIEECTRRVEKRRTARDAKGTWNKDALVSKHNYVSRMLQRCKDEGIKHVELDPSTPYNKLITLLR